MKKIIIILLISILALTLSPEIFANEQSDEYIYLINDDFESNEIETEPAGWKINLSGKENESVKIYDIGSPFNKCVLLTNRGEVVGMEKSFESQKEKVFIEFAFRLNQIQDWHNIAMTNGGGINIVTKNNDICWYDSSGVTGEGVFLPIIPSYAIRVRYKIKVEADVRTRKANIYVNDSETPVLTQVNFGNSTVLDISKFMSTTTNKSGKTYYIDDIKVYTIKKAPTSIEIVGSDKIGIKTTSAVSSAYTANVLDIEGSVMPAEIVTWSILDAPEGVEIRSDGILTVHELAQNTEITVRATSVTNPNIVNDLKVSLYKILPSLIEITGESNIIIPFSGEREYTYTATVKDEYGALMDWETADISLENTVGVKINETGLLTVSSDAISSVFNLKAVCKSTPSITDTLPVSMEIDINAASITLPVDKNNVTADFKLPLTITYGGEKLNISWVSSNSDILKISGNTVIVHRPYNDTVTNLMATISYKEKTKAVEYSCNVKKAITSSGGGGGGGGGGLKNNAPQTIVIDTETVKVKPEKEVLSAKFVDLQSVAWAENSINNLVSLGLINGVSNTLFEPERSITKAEYIKLLTLAFKKLDTSATCSITDITPSDWFYPYIASCAKLGIIQENDSFNPDNAITRMEMASYTYLIMQKTGFNFSNTSNVEAFEDEYLITDKQAVKAMQEANILSGKGNNLFDPEGVTKRAEATTVIDRILAAKGGF